MSIRKKLFKPLVFLSRSGKKTGLFLLRNRFSSRNIRRRIILIISIFVIFALNLILASGHIFHRLPNMVEKLVEKTPMLALNDMAFKTRLFPYPHLFTDNIELRIKGHGTLVIKQASITINLFTLLFNSNKRLSQIHLDDVHFYVEAPAAKKRDFYFAVSDFNAVSYAADLTKKITNVIQENLARTNILYINSFSFYVPKVSKIKPLFVARSFYFEDTQFFDTNAKAGTSVFFNDWLKVDLEITFFKNQVNKFQNAEINLENELNLSNIHNYFGFSDKKLKGKILTSHNININFSKSSVVHSNVVKVVELKINNQWNYTTLSVQEKNPFTFTISGKANPKKIEVDHFSVDFAGKKLEANLLWDFQSRQIELKFDEKQILDFYSVANLLGNFLPEAFYKIAYNSPGYLKPIFFQFDPVTLASRYEFFIFIEPKLQRNLKSKIPFQFSGFINGTEKTVKSRHIKMTNKRSSVHLYNLSFSLSSFPALSAVTTGQIDLQDLVENGRGILSFNSYFYCSILKNIFCYNNDWQANGEDLHLPVGWLTSLYSFLQMKPVKNILFNSISANGKLNGSYIEIEKTSLNTELGKIRVKGKLKITDLEGSLKFLFLPRQQQNAFMPNSDNAVTFSLEHKEGKMKMLEMPQWLKQK